MGNQNVNLITDIYRILGITDKVLATDSPVLEEDGGALRQELEDVCGQDFCYYYPIVADPTNPKDYLVPLALVLLGPALGRGVYKIAKWWLSRNTGTESEQYNYMVEIAKRQQKIYQNYEELQKKLKNELNEKDEIIRQQQKKLAEYELMLKILREKYDEARNFA